jgi:hypothetical protein
VLRTLLAIAMLVSCKKTLSTTDLRLEIRSEAGHEWVEVIEPAQMRAANAWISMCREATPASRLEVVYQSPRVVSFACRGSAKPLLASFRISTGRRLTLDDTIQRLKSGGFQDAVLKAARKRGLPEPQSPPQEFALTAAGFVYEFHGTEVTIPSTEMRPLLTPEAALLLGR